MKSLRIVFIAWVLLFCSLSVQAANFSADSLVVAGGRKLSSRFFYAGDRWRLDERLQKGEHRVTIFREDKRSLFVLWPEKKRYLVQQLPDREFKMIATRKPGEETEKKELGQEKVLGYETTKYRVTYDVQGRTMTSIEWFSKDLGVVIKSQAEDNTWSSEITNIKEGKQDGSLFEIPKGYQQLSDKDIFKAPQAP